MAFYSDIYILTNLKRVSRYKINIKKIGNVLNFI